MFSAGQLAMLQAPLQIHDCITGHAEGCSPPLAANVPFKNSCGTTKVLTESKMVLISIWMLVANCIIERAHLAEPLAARTACPLGCHATSLSSYQVHTPRSISLDSRR